MQFGGGGRNVGDGMLSLPSGQCLHARAVVATTREELSLLEDNAQFHSPHRAYLCPTVEIESEGNLAINLIAEWGVPTSIVDGLRRELGPKLARKDDLAAARGAPRAAFEGLFAGSARVRRRRR